MIIVMKKGATKKDIDDVVKRLKDAGVEVHLSEGKFRTIIGAIGDEEVVRGLPLTALPSVEKVMPVLKPYKLVSREFKEEEDTVIEVNGVSIGQGTIAVMAGPCSVETENQVISTARAVKDLGACILRGGAFKPRTSPYSFRGLGEEGLKILKKASSEVGIPVVTEVMEIRQIKLVEKYADIFQVGARNMQNFNLLSELGKSEKPVLLKRGFSNTVEELLTSAEYIAREGNDRIILCERGIRTFESSVRNSLDISSVPVLKSLTHLPVIVDPSHAAGRRDIIPDLSLAAIAAGADGLLIEVHPNPSEALCDGPQSLNFNEFSVLMDRIKEISKIFRKKLS